MTHRPLGETQPRVETMVMRCLKYDPECLWNYRRLVLQYWTLIDGVFSYDESTGVFTAQRGSLHLLTSPESIDRAFRLLVERKIVAFREEDRVRRAKLEEEYRIYHSPKNAVDYREGMNHFKEE